MFGSVCSGKPVQLAEQIEANKYKIEIENGHKISHVAIFLLPNVNLDPQYQALIYFQLPNQPYKLFGSISQVKPSAIFKLKNNQSSGNSQILDDIDMDDRIIDPQNNITVGISIEPFNEAERLLQELKYSQSSTQLAVVNKNQTINDPTSTAILAGKIVKHAYNYLTGFVDDQGRVNIKFFDSWWDKFRTRLQNDPKFLESQD